MDENHRRHRAISRRPTALLGPDEKKFTYLSNLTASFHRFWLLPKTVQCFKFCMFRFMCITKKNACETLGQITFFRVSRVPNELESKAMDWNFQSVKYLNDLVQNYGLRKSGGRGAESQESIRKNEHACSVLGVFVVSDLSARPYLMVAAPTRKLQSSSKLRQVRCVRSESEKQKSRTRRWGSLA